jgi:alkaline phosphatase D
VIGPFRSNGIEEGVPVIRHSTAARAWLGALALACAATAPAQAQTPVVAQGPMIGAVTGTSAGVWFRLSAPASVRVRWLAPDAADYAYTDPVNVTPDADDTGRVALAGLAPGQSYTYQVGITGADGVETWTGAYAFSTIPDGVDHVSFSVLSDFSNKLKGSPALRDALSKNPDFLAVIGDLDHRNPAAESKKTYYPQSDAALVLADMRAMHRDTRDFGTAIGNDFATGLIGQPDSGQRQIPLYYGWDDHDFCANNATANCPFAAQSVQAYREYYLWSASNGIDGTNGCAQANDYQRIDYGTLLSVFILDARSARQHGAKTTLLGACQLNWLMQGLATTQAKWKVVLSPVPFNPTIKTWDAWGSAPTERKQLVSFLQNHHVANLLFMSGDVHSGGAVDDGTHSNWPEVSVPHANMPDSWINTFCELTDRGRSARSEPGLWTIGSLVEPDFDANPTPSCGGTTLKKNTHLIYPPVGVYASNGKGHPGYVRVDVTPGSLTAVVIGYDGKPRLGTLADGSWVPMSVQLTSQ